MLRLDPYFNLDGGKQHDLGLAPVLLQKTVNLEGFLLQFLDIAEQ